MVPNLGHEEAVKQTLENPDQVRQSRSDPQVPLFYQAAGDRRWVCAVTKHATGQGFLITALRPRGQNAYRLVHGTLARVHL